MQVASPEIRHELEEFAADTEYFEQHRQELLTRYLERWVAVYRKQVVGAAKTLPRLLAQLERKAIPKGRAYIEYLTEKEELLIL